MKVIGKYIYTNLEISDKFDVRLNADFIFNFAAGKVNFK